MKTYFKDKVVFITGSSKGIGKAAALLFGSYGSMVCINGRDIKALEDTFQELSQMRVESLQLPGDVSDSTQCSDMVKKIIDTFGRLDILINNAGIASHGKVRDLTIGAWNRVVGINLMGPVYMSTYALPHIIASKGSILFISTPAGKVGLPGHAAYSVSKMGLTALVEAMQIELRKTGVHAGIIYVGFTENDENKQILYPDGTYKKMPVRKIRQTGQEVVAKAIVKTLYAKKNSLTMGVVGKLQAFALKYCPFAVKIILQKADRDYDTMYDQ